jgi:hypothetical protein
MATTSLQPKDFSSHAAKRLASAPSYLEIMNSGKCVLRRINALRIIGWLSDFAAGDMPPGDEIALAIDDLSRINVVNHERALRVLTRFKDGISGVGIDFSGSLYEISLLAHELIFGSDGSDPGNKVRSTNSPYNGSPYACVVLYFK